MKEIKIKANQVKVLKEVAQKAEYVGAKKLDDETALERIGIVDEDNDELKTMWDECVTVVSEKFMGVATDEKMAEDNEGDYEITIKVRDTWLPSMTHSMNMGLHKYFVHSILARWFMQSNKEEAEAYAIQADDYLNAIWRKSLTRNLTRTQRPF